MANICCDDVIFYTEGNPEGLYDLWEDLETYIILNQNPDLCWIGNLFSHKKIDSTGISLRGNVSYMEWNDTYILLSLETAWTPLYEAYQAIAAAYHVPFVMQSIEPGERIYYNTDEAHLPVKNLSWIHGQKLNDCIFQLRKLQIIFTDLNPLCSIINTEVSVESVFRLPFMTLLTLQMCNNTSIQFFQTKRLQYIVIPTG